MRSDRHDKQHTTGTRRRRCAHGDDGHITLGCDTLFGARDLFPVLAAFVFTLTN